jgi:MEDS: MEthanogen/methylotroph, DcmR Sensory domain/PAS fold
MSTSALSPDPRNSPTPQRVESAAQSEHVVYFYQESDSLLESLSDFIGSALGAGNAAIVIATKVHLDGLQQRLKARGLDTLRASRQGRYVAFDASVLLSQIMINGMPDEDRFAGTVGRAIAKISVALKSPRPEIAAFGEMVALLWTDSKIEAAIQLEQFWNELAKKYSFTLRCAYPMTGCHGEKNIQPLARVCAEHSAAFFQDGDTFHRGSENKIELRRTEERFRLLVDAVQDYAIFMLDVQGHVSSWNTGAQRIKGYAVSEIIGKHFSIFYPEEDLQTGKPARELEIAAKEGRFEDEGWLALLGQRDHFGDKKRERRTDRIRKSDSRLYREDKVQRRITQRGRRENGGAAKVARFGKVAPPTFTPAFANARRGTPAHRQRSSR